MNSSFRGTVRLAFEDSRAQGAPMFLVHGLGCDHTFLSKQAAYFGKSRRVISIDLRGHGMSDAPNEEYTMQAFCDDLAWLCAALSIEKAVWVGHSMGGNIALTMSGLYPERVSSIVMLDSVIFPTESLLAGLGPLSEAMAGEAYLSELRRTLGTLCLPSDAYTELLLSKVQGRQDVIASALLNQLARFDSLRAASACHVPAAYIEAAASLADTAKFRETTPHLIVGKTIGAGHFAPYEVPEQVNAMIERFLTITGT